MALRTWKKGTECELIQDDEDKDKYLLRYYSGDNKGFYEDDITIEIHPQKAMYLHGGNDDISFYLYPLQVKKLYELLKFQVFKEK